MQKLTYEEFKLKYIARNVREKLENVIEELIKFYGFTHDTAVDQIENIIKHEYNLYLSNEYYPEP